MKLSSTPSMDSWIGLVFTKGIFIVSALVSRSTAEQNISYQLNHVCKYSVSQGLHVGSARFVCKNPYKV